jgi:hypothetical protein
MDTKYISCADTAKMIRKELKKNFKNTKFYVRSSTYAGGASIDIDWVDGPTEREVNAVVKIYQGADFDGMIDLKTHIDHWLMPDGTVEIAKHQGTTGSMGVIQGFENEQPHPDAIRVSLGADFIHASRNCSRELIEAVVAATCERTGWDRPEIKDRTAYLTRNKNVPAAYIENDFDRQHEIDDIRRVLWATSAVDGIDCQGALDEQFPAWSPEETGEQETEEHSESAQAFAEALLNESAESVKVITETRMIVDNVGEPHFVTTVCDIAQEPTSNIIHSFKWNRCKADPKKFRKL